MFIAESQDTVAPGDRGVPGPEKENVRQGAVMEPALRPWTHLAPRMIVRLEKMKVVIITETS